MELHRERLQGKHISIFQKYLILWWEFYDVLLRKKENHFVGTFWTFWGWLALKRTVLTALRDILQSLKPWAWLFFFSKKNYFSLQKSAWIYLNHFFTFSTLFINVIKKENALRCTYQENPLNSPIKTKCWGVQGAIISKIGDRFGKKLLGMAGDARSIPSIVYTFWLRVFRPTFLWQMS